MKIAILISAINKFYYYHHHHHHYYYYYYIVKIMKNQ